MPSIEKSVNGLVLYESFDRADSSVLGNGWTEESGDWQIKTNRLLGQSDTTATTRSIVKDLGVALLKVFVQVLFSSRNSSDTADSLVHRGGVDIFGPAGNNGYRLYFDKLQNDLEIHKITAGSPTLLAEDTNAGRSSSLQPIQMYLEDGIQQARSGNAADGQVNTTDAVHSFPGGATTTRLRVMSSHPAAGNSAARPAFDDLLVFSDKVVTVTGLPLGFKARIVNLSAVNIVEAEEAAGTAVLDCIRGTAADYVPVDGWVAIQILDPTDVIVLNSEGAVYPGDTWVYDPDGGEEEPPPEGECPWFWTLIDGDLPPGLTLNTETGQLEGTPEVAGVYEFTYEVSNCVAVFTKSCQITIQGSAFEIEPEKPDCTWMFNLGRLQSDGKQVWHRHSRILYRPTVVNGTDIIFAGTFDPLLGDTVENTVMKFDRKGSVASGAYWILPSLNQGEYAGYELTASRVFVFYEAAGVGAFGIDASPNGGLSWQSNYLPTASVINTNGQVRRAQQALGVTGFDVRIRIRFPTSLLTRIHYVIVDRIRRGRL